MAGGGSARKRKAPRGEAGAASTALEPSQLESGDAAAVQAIAEAAKAAAKAQEDAERAVASAVEKMAR